MSEGFEVYGNGIQPQVENMGDIAPGRARHGEKSGPQGRGAGVVQTVVDKKRRTRQSMEIMKMILKLGEGEVPDSSAEGWTVEGERRRVTRKE